MSRAYTPNDAKQIQTAFDNLTNEEQDNLIAGLNADGITQKGILLYYAPAFIQNAVNADSENKVEMLNKTFGIMSEIYKNNSGENQEEPIKIVSLSNIATAIKNSPHESQENLLACL